MNPEPEPDAGPEADGTAPLPRVDDWDDEPDTPDPGGRRAASSLAGDPRMPIWIGRAVAATIVAIGVTIWLNWRYGLTAAALVAIADTLYRSRTTSVIPASAMVSSAQRRTKRRLMLVRPYGYVALHARAIPGTGSVIDHLVIGPGGVFALDSERWDRRLPVRTGAAGLLYHGPFGRRERLEHARWEAGQASLLLRAALHRPVPVKPAMAIYGPTIPWTFANLDGVDVFAGRRLRKYLRRQTRKNRANRLDPEQVAVIYNAAAAALPPAR
jgi:Nuclease-related domain